MTRPPVVLLLCTLAACTRGGGAAPPVVEPGATPPAAAPAPAGDPNPSRPGTPPDDDDADLDTDAEAAGVRRLWRSTRSGVETPERLVLRDQPSLANLWQRLGSDAPPPEVDLARELVVAVASGAKPTGGHSISVGRAVLDDGTLVIEVLETAPARTCLTSQAFTQPVDVVAVPADGVEKWRFVERQEVGGCGG